MSSAVLGIVFLTAFLLPIVSSDVYAVSNTLAEEKNSPANKALVAKANKDGSVRIIVRVKTIKTFQPMADTAAAPAREQMRQIASAQESVLTEVAGYNVSKSYKFKYTPYISMTVDSAALDTLLASPDVADVQEDTLSAPTLDLSVPRIGASDLHSSAIKGTGVTIAVLDTGVDKNHPFLANSVVSEACYSSNDPVYSSTTICPGGATDSIATDSATPYLSSVCPAGDCDHGTHVAGIAGGRQSVGGSPGPGVAPESHIIAVQVFSRFDSEKYCGVGNSPCVMAFSSDIIKGLERVYELRSSYTLASVNMSLGGGQYFSACDSDPRKAIIDNLRAAGIATIISSGNDGYCKSISAPACISSAISVGATTDSDTVASYSNSATFMSLLAPGSAITSSIPGSGYASWYGTSMAAPHVTGAWALIKQQMSTATVTEILNAFQSTGVSITDSKCPSVTKKRINAAQALASFPIFPTQLHNNVTVTNLTGAVDAMLDYYIAVPAGVPSLTIQTWGGTGDADLYVRYGSQPTTTAYDYQSWVVGNTENIVINNPQAGNWYVSIHGYSAFSGVSLKAEFPYSPWVFFLPAILSKPQ
jgi:subtilisin family serine protease